MMKGVCMRYAANEEEAEDILQEAFIRGFKNLNKYNETGPLGAWLRKIAVNTALEQYRKNKSLKNISAMFDHSESRLTVEDGAIEQLELEDLLLKIQQLPTGFRTVFNLYAIEGYNHREIAKMLSISEGTSKSQYSRARVILRAMIENELKGEKKMLAQWSGS
ncbi:MAG: sigma-70 family RNA polymerase sigma factor [Crocinitomicaceae bacterium]|nr:sigma-70 family RNA polymerase sigma factor [Crocinitomicaceae bacterium]